MKNIYLGRSGQMENTTFAILSPDGKTKLTRSGRGPFHQYRNASQMAAGMDQIATRLQVKPQQVGSDTSLPFSESVEVGLNISASDNIPMIVLAANDDSALRKLENRLLPLAWSDSMIGQFNYAKTSNVEDLKSLSGIEKDVSDRDLILVVEPGQFGLSGRLMARIDSAADAKEIQQVMVDAIENCKRLSKDHRSHVELGIQLGIDWQSEIPETDQQSIRARKRARGE